MARGGRSTGTGTPLAGAVGEAAAALMAVLVFARTVSFGWVYDDQMEVVGNAFLRSLSQVPTLFSSTAWAGAGMETYLYRPLSLLTYALNFQISGLDAWSYHLVNVLLHAGVSVLVVRLGLAWGLSALAAGAGGVLFALHPVHVEAAAAVFGRKDLLSTLFVLLMVLGHRRALATGGWRQFLPTLAFAAALLSKEAGAVGLPLVAVHDLLLQSDKRRLGSQPRLPILYAAYLGVFLLYLLTRTWVTGTLGVPETSFYDNPLVDAGIVVRLATSVVVVGKGILLLLVPVGLSPDYSFNAIPLVTSPIDPRLLVSLAGGATAVALLVRHLGSRRDRGDHRPSVPLLAVAWYGIALLPVSNLLVTTGTIFGERLLYLPSVGFALLLADAFRRVEERQRPAGRIALAVVLLGFAVQTVRYSGAWTDDIALFRWAVRTQPTSTKAQHKLGEELLRIGELGGAIRALDRALAIAPGNEFAAVTRGQATRLVGSQYLPASFGGAGETPPRDADVLYVLGQLFREAGQMERALELWQEALAVDPAHPESLADLAPVWVARGDTAGALEFLETATAARPSLASAWFNLAQLRLARGELSRAREALRRFIETAGPSLASQVGWARRVLEELDQR